MTEPAPSRPAALAVEDLACRFGRVQALAGVSLAVRPGEVMALLGDSGCGKSTLLRVVAGLEAPQAGTVRLDGRLVAGPGTRVPPEARGVGLMFQDYALFPHLTVRENIRFGLKGQPPAAREAADELLEQVGLAAHAGAYPQTCRAASSSGWRWCGRSPRDRGCCSSTSRSPTSTGGCATGCARTRWRSCAAPAPPP